MKFKKKILTNLKAADKESFLFPILSIIIALFISGIFISLSGASPIVAYKALLEGSLGNWYAIADTVKSAVPLILTGLSLSFAGKTGVFNIGAEGQLYMGALFATLVGLFLDLPPLLHSLVAMIAAVVGGALWALIAAVLKDKRGVNVVISTIMLNYLGINFVHYIVNNPLKTKGLLIATDKIKESARLPYLVAMPYGITTAIIIVLVVVAFIYILLNKTAVGYKIKAVGENKDAAQYAGIKIDVLVLMSLVIAGALAGLGGGLEILGRQHRLETGFSPGYGFSGIPIALLARRHPIGVVFSALFFSILRTGAVNMQASAGVSSSVIQVIQGLVILFIAGEFAVKYLVKKSKNKKNSKVEIESNEEVKTS